MANWLKKALGVRPAQPKQSSVVQLGPARVAKTVASKADSNRPDTNRVLADLDHNLQKLSASVARVEREWLQDSDRPLHERRNEDHDRRRDFLEATNAAPTPIELWALWAALYMEQKGPGAITALEYNYESIVDRVTVKSNGSTMRRVDAIRLGLTADDYTYSTFGEPDYGELSQSYWTPTLGGAVVPENFGSAAMKLLVFDAVADVANATWTNRRGWEYGHTQVYRIRGTEDLYAETLSTRISMPADVISLASRPDAVEECLQDVVALGLRSRS